IHFSTAVAWLPTKRRLPVPSSPMIAESPKGRGKHSITPWKVHAFRVPAGDAVEILSRMNGRRQLAPGIFAGVDLRYWWSAFQFALALTAREQILPALDRRGDVFRAAWEPVIMGRDADRLTRLAQAMPGVARAVSSEIGLNKPPNRAAADGLLDFICQM